MTVPIGAPRPAPDDVLRAALDAAIAGVFVADKIVEFIKGTVEEAGKAQVVNTALANSIEHNNQLTRESAAAFEEQALAIEKVTGTGHLEIEQAQARLATFKFTQAQIQQLTPRVVDLSRKFGIDLSTAARLVGRTADGAGNGLTRMGVVVDKAAYKTDAFGSTLAALNRAAGGAGAAFGRTLPGQLARAGTQFDDLKEKVGVVLVPALARLAGEFADRLIPAVEKLAATYGPQLTAQFRAVGAVVERNRPQIEALGRALITIGRDVLPLGVGAFKVFVQQIKLSISVVSFLERAFVTMRGVVIGAIEGVLHGLDRFLGGVQAVARIASLIPGPTQAAFRKVAASVGDARTQVEQLAGALRGLPSVIPVRIAISQTGNIANVQGARDFAAQRPHALGGWVNEPVLGYGLRSGQSYSFAERGREYVSPTGTGPGGGSVIDYDRLAGAVAAAILPAVDRPVILQADHREIARVVGDGNRLNARR